jgi:hexosaminidase
MVYQIIPFPQNQEKSQGNFELSENTHLFFGNLPKTRIDFLIKYFEEFGLFQKSTSLISTSSDENCVEFILDSSLQNLNSEGYYLEITIKKISIKSPSEKGIFYAIQTLRQILFKLSQDSQSSSQKLPSKHFSIECGKIEDSPRFSWRGYMLDEGRHFHGKDTVKRMLDIMALLKFNTLHWHLTEDQGWRIEIKKYPKLTEIGSKRTNTQINGYISHKKSNQPHSGFYTQADIKEIVQYAADRYITIIPEIDMPGHAQAALAAYPELSCTGGPFEVSTHFGIHKEVYCPGKEAVFDFLQHVIDEIMLLFPSKIVHIGGDEVPKARWNDCPDCQKRMKNEKISNAHNLQVYFTNRIARYIQEKGWHVIGWNEILGESLSSHVMCQFWKGKHQTKLENLRNGRKMVMSDFPYVYLDHWYNFTSLSKAYRYEPIPSDLESQYWSNILGIEACMWTEFVPTRRRLEWQTFPRLIAFAEVGWSQKKSKNFISFKERLSSFLKILDKWNVNYAKENEVEPSKFKQKISIFTLVFAPRGGN